MEKIDPKKTLKALFTAPKGRFAKVDVPQLAYVMINGQGDPNSAPSYKTAIQWLFSLSYAMKFTSKSEFEQDYVVPPLEGLWWSDDPTDFITRRKDRWHWTMMIMVPDFVGKDLYEAVLPKVRVKLGEAPDSLRLASLTEGLALQTLHIGSFDDEAPILAQLHDEVMPSQKLTFNGKHHEIYLSDARKTPPSKLRTILRQPVRYAPS